MAEHDNNNTRPGCYIDDELAYGAEGVLQSCNCLKYDDPNCQLTNPEFHDEKPALCKPNTDSTCRSAVKRWADSFRTGSNANDPACYLKDPMYRLSQRTLESCSTG